MLRLFAVCFLASCVGYQWQPYAEVSYGEYESLGGGWTADPGDFDSLGTADHMGWGVMLGASLVPPMNFSPEAIMALRQQAAAPTIVVNPAPVPVAPQPTVGPLPDDPHEGDHAHWFQWFLGADLITKVIIAGCLVFMTVASIFWRRQAVQILRALVFWRKGQAPPNGANGDEKKP